MAIPEWLASLLRDASTLVGRRNLPLAVVVALAAVLRFGFLGRQSYWYDGAVTVEVLHKSFLGMLGALPHSESTPPLYYVIAWPWSRLFGIREFGLRSLSAVLGTATVAASYALGRTCISARAGLVAASLVACSPFLVWYSQEARSYALLAFLTALSAVAFARARRAPTRRALASWALIACLALLTHYFAVFVVAAEALWLVVVRYRLRAVWAAVAATAIVGGALLPLAIDQEGTGQTNWIAARSLTGRIRETLTQFVSGQYVPPHHLAMLAALAAALILAVGLARMVEGTQRSGAMSVSALACFGIVAPLVVASTRFDKFFYRNLIGVWPLLAVGLAAVLASRRAGWIGLVLAVGACAVELGSLSLVLERPSLQRDNWRSATAAIGADARSLAIVTNRGGALAPLRVYRPHAYRMPAGGAVVREIVFVGFAKQLDFRPPTGFAIVEQRRVSGFAFMRLRSARPVDVTPHELAAAIRGLRVAVLVERGAGPPEG